MTTVTGKLTLVSMQVHSFQVHSFSLTRCSVYSMSACDHKYKSIITCKQHVHVELRVLYSSLHRLSSSFPTSNPESLSDDGKGDVLAVRLTAEEHKEVC